MREYKNYIRRKVIILSAAVLLLPLVLFYSLTAGPADISCSEVIRILLGFDAPENKGRIIFYARLPQAIAAILAGAGLSVAGASVQSVLRNPLCSPFTLGISGAAAFGAALTVFFAGTSISAVQQPLGGLGINFGFQLSVTAGAFLSSIAATVFILALAVRCQSKPETVILMGVALGAFYGACIMLLQYFADERQLAAIVYWSFGDTQRATWSSLLPIAVLVAVSCLYFISQCWNYNALALGEEAAASVGTPTQRVRLLTMIFASLITAVLTASLGVIGFIGLVVPHLARLIIGCDYRFVIPFSLVVGAVFLLAADTFSRVILPGRLMPVSIITAFLGAPVFLLMLTGKGRTDA
ncbi:MAG: iron ABC transporter permease [Planctomycetaceae bacterium]|nr:iron ABC transporter permease [Planctomycetaceae bacterium]